MAPSKTTKTNIHQETLRFNLDNPEQAKAIAIYEGMLKTHPYAKSLCTLLPHVLTVFAEQARTHPSLNNQQAALIAKYQDQVLALVAALERGEKVTGLDSLMQQAPTAALAPAPPADYSSTSTPAPPQAGEAAPISVDWNAM